MFLRRSPHEDFKVNLKALVLNILLEYQNAFCKKKIVYKIFVQYFISKILL
jgi:hypothetical protein